MLLILFRNHKLSKNHLSNRVMEIYSPISKNKDLFKKNRFKAEQAYENSLEIKDEPEPYFKKAKVTRKHESIFSTVGKTFADKLKRIFEFEEA
jgi:hypothetical protein